MTKKFMKRFYQAYEFIQDHPAFNGDYNTKGIKGIDIRVDQQCKHGLSKWEPVYVYEDNPRFNEFLESAKDCQRHEEGGVGELWIHYKDYYGHEWKHDHVAFRIEAGANRYLRCSSHPVLKEWHWARWHDQRLEAKGSTYEEVIVNFAELVKEFYGDYSESLMNDNCIIPDWVIKHNEKNPMFLEPLIDENGQFNRNPESVHVSDKQVNEIWWSIHMTDDDRKLRSDVELQDVSKIISGPFLALFLTDKKDVPEDKEMPMCEHFVPLCYPCEQCGDVEL